MGNKWDEMREAYREAESIIRATDVIIADMTRMISGKLHHVDLKYENIKALCALKRELANFNIQTERWMR